MGIGDALWKVFEATGHIGAYLLYKDYCNDEGGAALDNSESY